MNGRQWGFLARVLACGFAGCAITAALRFQYHHDIQSGAVVFGTVTALGTVTCAVMAHRS